MRIQIAVLALILVPFSGCIEELEAHTHHDGHDEPGHEGELSHDAQAGHQHEQTGMERPDFARANGKVPSESDAEAFEQKMQLRIIGDEEFRPATGVRSGNGSAENPYVIEHWHVTGDLYLKDTDACFIVRENYIAGQLTLNWNGICSHVHHNYINDLRVNENNRRDGYATGGLLEFNKIGYVGQLRHYDGEFRYNTVGPMPAAGPFDDVQETVPFMFATDPRIANIDGFNQGLIHNNTFHGSVDLDFHGHHHGTGFFAPHSHYHGDNETRKMDHDHTQRWTSVLFADNQIIDPDGYGLRYDDRNHAGDDRTANSEQEDTLKLEHFHRSLIEIRGNRINGAGLWVDIFNADDSLHKERNNGTLVISDNHITLVEKDQLPNGFFGTGFNQYSALRIFASKEANITLAGNELEFVARQRDALDLLDPEVAPVAIDLDRVKDAYIEILDNKASGFAVGLKAGGFDELVSWRWSGNDWGDAVAIQADDSVPMADE